MKWGESQPRFFWTLLLGSALGAAIATALGWFIQTAQLIVR